MDAVGLITTRDAGHVRVAFVSYYDEPLEEVLMRFGLRSPEPASDSLRQVTRREALSAIVALLQRDMAYDADLMSSEDAARFGELFLSSFGADDVRFFSNRHDVGWNPLTSSTFDSGIVCLSKPVAGCIWFEDED